MYQFAENVILILIALVIVISILGVIGAIWARLKVKRAKNRLRVLANYVDDKDVARRISELAEEI
jgi:flagellar basal body-associated protein FliL